MSSRVLERKLKNGIAMARRTFSPEHRKELVAVVRVVAARRWRRLTLDEKKVYAVSGEATSGVKVRAADGTWRREAVPCVEEMVQKLEEWTTPKKEASDKIRQTKNKNKKF